MVSALLENLLVRTDNLIERVFRSPRDREPIEFGRYLNAPERILLVADHDLAGTCLASCFIPAIRRKFPSAEIGIVLDPRHSDLFDGLELVKTWPWANRTPHQLDSGFRRLSAELRKHDYHWGLNFSSGGRAEALLTYASGAAIRTGVSRDDSDKYYNLIVKSDSAGGQIDRLVHLLCALKLEFPGGQPDISLALTNSERQRAQRFIRQRKNSRGDGAFIGFAPEVKPGEKAMERLLQRTCNRLTAQYEPLRMMVAGNLAPAVELKKNEQLSAHLVLFDNLRQMVGALAYCDRVVTGSAGLAWLLGRMGARVALIATGKDRLAELGIKIPDNLTIIRDSDEGGAEELAVRFTK
jgi:ADP-heptose:LPS heptosyltransferase